MVDGQPIKLGLWDTTAKVLTRKGPQVQIPSRAILCSRAWMLYITPPITSRAARILPPKMTVAEQANFERVVYTIRYGGDLRCMAAPPLRPQGSA